MKLQSLKLQIKTHLYEKTVQYYQQVLQAEITETWQNENDRGTILGFQTMNQRVYLEIYESGKIHHYDAISLQFRVPSLADYMLQLPAQYLTARPIKRAWGSTYLHLTDPNGARVTIYQQE